MTDLPPNEPMKRTLNNSAPDSVVPPGNNRFRLGDLGSAIPRRLSPIRWAAMSRLVLTALLLAFGCASSGAVPACSPAPRLLLGVLLVLTKDSSAPNVVEQPDGSILVSNSCGTYEAKFCIEASLMGSPAEEITIAGHLGEWCRDPLELAHRYVLLQHQESGRWTAIKVYPTPIASGAVTKPNADSLGLGTFPPRRNFQRPRPYYADLSDLSSLEQSEIVSDAQFIVQDGEVYYSRGVDLEQILERLGAQPGDRRLTGAAAACLGL